MVIARPKHIAGRASRWLLASAAIVALLAAAMFGNLSGQITQVRTLLIGTLVSATGMSVRVNGSVRLANILPLEFTAEDLEFGDGRQIVTTKKLSIYPRLTQLLFGNATVRRVELEGVTMSIRRRRNGKIVLRGQPAFNDRLPELTNGRMNIRGLSEITLRDVDIDFDDLYGSLSGDYKAAVVRLNWEAGDPPMALSAQITDKAGTTKFELEATKQMADSWQNTLVEGKFESPVFSLGYDGRFTPGKVNEFSGAIVAAGPDLLNGLGNMGVKRPAESIALPWSAAGQATMFGSRVDLKDAEISLDGQDAVGAVKIVLGKTPTIAGTIDLSRLDLTDYLPGIAGKNREQATQATQRLDLLSLIDMDLRLSSRETQMGAMKLGETAATVYSKSGSLSLSVAETDLAGGRLQANLSARPDGKALDAEFTVRVRGASAVELAGLFEFPAIFDAEFSLDLTGSLDDIVVDNPLPVLTGHGVITATEAQWSGVAIARDDAGSPNLTREEGGSVVVERLSGKYEIADGLIVPEEMTARIENADYKVRGQITFDTGESKLELIGERVTWGISGFLSDPVVNGGRTSESTPTPTSN